MGWRVLATPRRVEPLLEQLEGTVRSNMITRFMGPLEECRDTVARHNYPVLMPEAFLVLLPLFLVDQGGFQMLGGDSPCLQKVLRVSAYFCIGSIYTYVVWRDLMKKLEDRKWRRSPKNDNKLYKPYKKGLDCTNAKGCVSEPLLHIEERFKFVAMCILHLVIPVGDYLTKFIRKKCKHLPPATRDRVQDRLNCAKTKISLKGHAPPNGEETWLLLANWRHIGKAMKLSNHVIDVVVQMASLLTALQTWEFNLNALNCKSIAEKVKETICPTIRSPYLLWLQYDAPKALKNLHP